MNRKQIIGAVVAAVLFVTVGTASVFANAFSRKILEKPAEQSVERLLSGGASVTLPTEPFIGVVKVNGTIQQQEETSVFDTTAGYQHTATLEYIDELIQSEDNKGLLLKVDSPGGTVYESEELYLKLKEYKEKTGRQIWTYMEHYAASGGYMISAAADKIYANSNTTTGSIGVIISGVDMSGLYEKLGIRSFSITSGKNKDMSEMNEEQVAIYQAIVDESYERFVEIVSSGRNMSADEVKKLADGRIYTAKQALGNKLIDEIALYDDMEAQMKEALGVSVLYEPEQKKNVIAQLFGKIEQAKTKSEAEVLTDLAEQFGNGVPMYYAEQLQ